MRVCFWESPASSFCRTVSKSFTTDLFYRAQGTSLNGIVGDKEGSCICSEMQKEDRGRGYPSTGRVNCPSFGSQIVRVSLGMFKKRPASSDGQERKVGLLSQAKSEPDNS
jgi:hypothetical protein